MADQACRRLPDAEALQTPSRKAAFGSENERCCAATASGAWATTARHWRTNKPKFLTFVELRIDSVLEKDDDVRAAELEVPELFSLGHVATRHRGEDDR